MNNKQRTREKSLGAGAERLGEFWRMIECLWSILELEIEDRGFQA
jgi:hypothetical protein